MEAPNNNNICILQVLIYIHLFDLHPLVDINILTQQGSCSNKTTCWHEYIITHKRKHCGAVDERSSEQQFHKFNMITFVVWKTGALGIVEPGLTAGRPMGWQTNRLADHLGDKNVVK